MGKKKAISKPRKVRQSPPITKGNNLLTWLTNSRLHLLAIMILCFVLYGNTISHDYAQDDAIVITENIFTQKGIAGIGDLLDKDTFHGFFKQQKNLVAGGRYRPLSLVTFAIEINLFGNTPSVSHFVNILLYGFTGIILYLVLLQLLNPSKKNNKLEAYFIALATSVLFIAHPIHTEVVANIKGRDEIMTLLGSLAATWFVLKAYSNKNKLYLLGAFVAMFLALLSKENAITFLAVIPLIFFFFRKKALKDGLLYTAPLLAAAVIFIIIRTAILGGFGSGETPMELMNNPFLKLEGNTYVEMNIGERAALIMATFGEYLKLLVFPHPLTHDYYPRQIPISSWGDFRVLGALLAYGAMTAYALWRLPKKDPIAFGILFYLITFSIVSNVVFPIGTNMAERFMFMPSIGFCFIIAVLLYRLTKYLAKTDVLNTSNFQKAALIVGVITIAYAGKTIIRNLAWKDNYTLFSTDIHTSTHSAKLNNAYGAECLQLAITKKGDVAIRKAVSKCLPYLNKALEIHPGYANTMLQLGNASVYSKDFEKGIEYYKQCLAMNPNGKDALNNMQITYRDGGKYFGETKQDFPKAQRFLEEAYRLNQNDAETCRLLGIIYGTTGQHNKALQKFQESIKLNPNNAVTHLNISVNYQALGDIDKANYHRSQALKLDPSLNQ